MSEIKDPTIVQKKPRRMAPDATRVVARAAVSSPAAASPEAGNATIVAGKEPALTFDIAETGAAVGVGTVLKQRFELTELLGVGGMGAVYKARDLRQVEAGDRQPWVALKVINESFSRHEHALAALQQEAKKTQRLAHPNIVSVYDFDREGDIAFMTMELLDGQSLDAVLARKPGGLPVAEVLPIIRQICQAIDYAHKQGIVHADLKPANIFLARDGRVKVLDFGIAHAMQADSHFDAQALNALTPTFASIPMLCGRRPRPVDDLYGLGCIFYLLLSGRHPFNRKRATEADAARLKPARLSQLNTAQWRALTLLLQFHPSGNAGIQDFQLDFFNERDTRIRRLALGFGLLLMLAVLTGTGIHYYLNRHLTQIAGDIVSFELPRVQVAVTEIQQLSGSDRIVVLDQARDRIAEAVEQHINGLATADDYHRLHEYLLQIGNLYPDSSRIQEAIARFTNERKQFIQALANGLERRIAERDFGGGPVSFAGQIESLRLVAPDHALFARHDLKSLLAREAGVAVYLGQRDKALDILAQANQLFPQDQAGFQRIRDRLARKPSAVPHPVVRESSAASVQQQEWQQAQALLQQFDLANHPEQLAGFFQALGKTQSSLYFALMQGLQDFFSGQRQKGNGNAFGNLPQQLFGVTPVMAAVQRHERIDPCPLRLANLGKQRGFRCRDSLTRSENGPELVVVKAGKLPPFAITRTEISVADYKLYCTLYRQCRTFPRQPDPLPITDITPQQAKHYANWLSSMSGYRYRLPTQAEWLAAARDDSGVSDQNCVLIVSGRAIRGNALRSVEEGYANSLGLLNVFGNAEEWVQQGGQLVAMGGAANMDIRRCNAQAQNEKASDANAFRGFRLVRELKN